MCHGSCTRVVPPYVAATLKKLDHREKAGYARHLVDVDLPSGRIHGAVMYVASHHNPNFLGEAPQDEMVAQIVRCHGASGSNIEYVKQLATTLRSKGASDSHVFELEAAVDQLLRARNG